MNRFRLFSFFLFCGLFCAGCATDDSSCPEEKGAETYLQIHIPRTGMESRTTGSPTTPGTPEENAISDLTVYLADNTEVIKIDRISVLSTSSDSYTSALIPIGRDLLNREFRLFLVANPGEADFSPRAAADFKEVYSTGTEGTRKLVAPGRMVMSNQVEQSPAPVIRVTSENSKTNPAKARVYLDRLAVKIVPQVSVDFGANFDGREKETAFFEGFTFTVEAAGLLNAATEFNLEQQWSESGNGTPVQLLSPTWHYKPQDEYFNRYYNTIADYTGDTPPFVPFNETAEEGFRLITSPFYCLENNPPFYDYTGSTLSPENQIETKYKGLTTGVIFRIQAKRDGQAVDFYRYEGEYYSGTESGRSALSEAANLISGDFEDISVLRAKGVRVYEEGNIYYTYWIKDKNYDLGYGIVRNSSYLLRAVGLTRIGDDVPGGGYEPGEPIDRIEQIEVVAVSRDWTLVDVTHDFN